MTEKKPRRTWSLKTLYRELTKFMEEGEGQELMWESSIGELRQKIRDAIADRALL